MANTHTTLTSLFTAIANAIRAKTGGAGAIAADNFPTEIAGITTGHNVATGTVSIAAAATSITISGFDFTPNSLMLLGEGASKTGTYNESRTIGINCADGKRYTTQMKASEYKYNMDYLNPSDGVSAITFGKGEVTITVATYGMLNGTYRWVVWD